MIREWLEYALTPASPTARQSGALYEAIAFQTRARRNQRLWSEHWSVCHKLVLKFCREHSQARTLAILGSGCLFEVPKTDLINRFEKIVLVDQVFPREVRKWASAVSHKTQIDLLEWDLAGVANSSGLLIERLQCDLVFSANLLSQLHLSPLALRPHLNPEEKENFRREVEQRHLEFMKLHSGRSLLWTDVLREFRQRDSSEILQTDATVLTALPQSLQTWDWNLAPAPEMFPDIDVVLKMRACRF